MKDGFEKAPNVDLGPLFLGGGHFLFLCRARIMTQVGVGLAD